MNYDFPTIRAISERALNELLIKDAFLFEKDVNERAISSKLAHYLQKCFEDLKVDAEYNRRFEGEKKKLNVLENEKRVFPDIIIHSRGNDDFNLLVIEIKKFDNPNIDLDEERLKEFTAKRKESDYLSYNYSYGLQIILNVEENYNKSLVLKWFKNSEIYKEYVYETQ